MHKKFGSTNLGQNILFLKMRVIYNLFFYHESCSASMTVAEAPNFPTI